MNKKVEVRNSNTHGKWIFAIEKIATWEIVLQWDISHQIPAEEEKTLSPEEKKYVCLFEWKYIQMQEPECYINHSCEANTYVWKFCDIAKRDIEIGEEITGNYNEVSSWGPVIQCNCWASICTWKIFS